jgi:hypothetical protein
MRAERFFNRQNSVSPRLEDSRLHDHGTDTPEHRVDQFAAGVVTDFFEVPREISPKWCRDSVTLRRMSSMCPTNRLTFATAPPVSEPLGTALWSDFA